MVASGAVEPHGRHAGVRPVLELDWLVKAGELVEQHHVGGLSKLVLEVWWTISERGHDLRQVSRAVGTRQVWHSVQSTLGSLASCADASPPAARRSTTPTRYAARSSLGAS